MRPAPFRGLPCRRVAARCWRRMRSSTPTSKALTWWSIPRRQRPTEPRARRWPRSQQSPLLTSCARSCRWTRLSFGCVTPPGKARANRPARCSAASAHPHLDAPLPGPNQGRGVAAGAWFNGSGPASAIASVNPDGTVSLVEGSPDIGGSRAAMAMQVAEVLGLPMEAVKPSIVDTDSIGYSSGAGGSGVTFKMGTACYEAAQDIKRQLIERAARIWQVETQDVVYDKGVLHHKPDPELRITFATLARRLNGI